MEPLDPSEIEKLNKGLISDEVAKYQEAYAQEFGQAEVQKRDLVEESRKLFELNSLSVAERIVAIALHGAKEAVSLAACKYIYDRVVPVTTTEGDPLTTFINKLTAGNTDEPGDS